MPVLESASDQAYYHQLPTVSFRLINDEALKQPAGVQSEQYRSYGYNDFSEFERPEYYIRYIEPIEAELRVQVEYDMDEQDQAWLDVINEERRKEQSGPITYETFEILMDKLEKEWFELIKRIPQPASHLPVEDSKCAVCDDGEGENSNAIVFCDGCNLAVHQDCYGVPYIPEGQWLCRKCTVSPENPVSCLFCPNEGGAFKQTTSGHWSHLLCAIWVPELGLGNAIYMEPVEGAENVPKNRWKLICSLCKERYGACIQCDNRSCFTAFHVTCARQMGLLQGMKSMGADTQLRAFCHKHLPADAQGVVDLEEEDSDYDGTPARPKKQKTGTVTTKSARAHAKSYRPGPPIVPHVIVQSLLEYTGKISIRKRQIFVERLCRYWSLKREARRGAPLLKRLHLEPWTASTASKQQTEAEKAIKLTFLTKLRNDLEKVRLLAEFGKKREKEKLKQSQVVKDVVDSFLFPQFAKLRLALEKISAMDRSEMFLNPVNQVEVTDYGDIVKEPMCWLWIDDKIERNAYRNVADFVRDIVLVLDNAMLYNPAEHQYHKAAKKIKAAAEPILEGLSSIRAEASMRAAGDEAEDLDATDLEPSRLLLNVLLELESPENIRDNLASIFAYELERPKEPTPPPPSPKKKVTQSAAEKKRKRDERLAQAQEMQKAGLVRATRGTKAAEQALEQDIGDSATPGPSRTRKGNTEPTKGEASTTRRHRQIGVVGLEIVNPISDKERRQQEKEMELVTQEVGKVDMFKRFNTGWVLAEGSKRDRKPRVEQVKPLPKKRKSQAAIVAQTPERTPSPPPSSLTPVSESSRGTRDQTAKSTPRVKRDDVHQERSIPDRVLTSAARKRQENSEKSSPAVTADKDLRLDSKHSDEVEEMTPTPTSPVHGLDHEMDEESEAEEEEQVEEQNDYIQVSAPPGKTASRPVKGRSRPKGNSRTKVEKSAVDVGEGEIEVDALDKASESESVEEDEEEEDLYPPGTLVWAKLGSFPFFPAEVLNPEDADEDDPIPEYVFTNRAKIEKDNHGEGQKTWLVRFFDKSNSYGWMPATRMDLLASDDSIDAMYLAGKQKGKTKPIRPEMKRNVREAFRIAMNHYEESAKVLGG